MLICFTAGEADSTAVKKGIRGIHGYQVKEWIIKEYQGCAVLQQFWMVGKYGRFPCCPKILSPGTVIEDGVLG